MDTPPKQLTAEHLDYLVKKRAPLFDGCSAALQRPLAWSFEHEARFLSAHDLVFGSHGRGVFPKVFPAIRSTLVALLPHGALRPLAESLDGKTVIRHQTIVDHIDAWYKTVLQLDWNERGSIVPLTCVTAYGDSTVAAENLATRVFIYLETFPETLPVELERPDSALF